MNNWETGGWEESLCYDVVVLAEALRRQVDVLDTAEFMEMRGALHSKLDCLADRIAARERASEAMSPDAAWRLLEAFKGRVGDQYLRENEGRRDTIRRQASALADRIMLRPVAMAAAQRLGFADAVRAYSSAGSRSSGHGAAH